MSEAKYLAVNRSTEFGTWNASLRDLPARDLSADPFLHVAIPVRNEEAHIEGALSALFDQRTRAGTRFPLDRYEVLLLANNCADRSVERARDFGRKHPDFALVIRDVRLSGEFAHVGWARRTAMEWASERSRGRQSRGFLATTDADSRVSPLWMASMMDEFDRGADAVCGRIGWDARESRRLGGLTIRRHDADDEYRMLVARLQDRMDPRPHDRWPRHYQHYGASFAVCAETYERAGGVPPVNGLEDVAFYEALVGIDARVRHSPAVCVATSARRHGRSAIGLSAQIRDWEDPAWEHVVESAEFVALHARLQRAVREAWESAAVVSDAALYQVASHAGVSLGVVKTEMFRHRYFGAALRGLRLRERLEQNWAGKVWRPIAPEIVKLRAMLDTGLGAAAEQVQAVAFPAETTYVDEVATAEK